MAITFTRPPWKKKELPPSTSSTLPPPNPPTPDIPVPVPVPAPVPPPVAPPIRIQHDEQERSHDTVYKLDSFQFYCILGLQLVYILIVLLSKKQYFV